MKYDLLIQHGEVIDPGAGLRGMLDVGVSGGKVVAVAPSLAASEAHRTISAKGLLVTPGLIDIHAHIFVNAHDMGGHTDHFCRASGVTRGGGRSGNPWSGGGPEGAAPDRSRSRRRGRPPPGRAW